MRLMFVAAVLAGCSLSFPARADGPSCENMIGTWTNQIGSTLTIKSIDQKTGEIQGTYVSPTDGKERSLIGWANSTKIPAAGSNVVKAISFTVQWGELGSITAWAGSCAGGAAPRLFMVWHMARTTSQFEWDHILTGFDTFTAKK